ncbi:MAG: tetratricopeptide repeat protein [Labilithrix sp.]|nr:tetratricopeptide repeat protein [Labilithrix sp.]
MRRSAIRVFAGLVVMFATGVARADEASPTAESLFQEARNLVDAGRYAEACPKLEQSQKLDPAVGTQFNLADCYEHIGRTATAHALFAEVARIARAAGKFEREKSAKERAAALEPRLARVDVRVDAPAPGLEVEIDGAAFDLKSAGAVPIDPGAHKVRARAPNRVAWESDLDAVEGRTTLLVVPALVDPTPKVAPAEAPSGLSTQRSIALAAFGVGVAGVIVGAIGGAIALSKNAAAEEACPKDIYQFRCPTEEGASAWTSATSAGTVSTVGFIVGGVALAGAGVLWITAPSRKTRVGTSLTGVIVEGTF